MNIARKIPTIHEEENFYGYIIGLAIEPNGDYDIPPHKMYASFDNKGVIEIWMVPDIQLFQMLAERLCIMAFERDVSDTCGSQKLYIEKKNGQWNVDVP